MHGKILTNGVYQKALHVSFVMSRKLFPILMVDVELLELGHNWRHDSLLLKFITM